VVSVAVINVAVVMVAVVTLTAAYTILMIFSILLLFKIAAANANETTNCARREVIPFRGSVIYTVHNAFCHNRIAHP
jgi:hypothetical protein